MSRSIDVADITIGEFASICGTIMGQPVTDFVLLVSVPHGEGCADSDCEGASAMVCSRSGEGIGHDEPFVLHMLSRAIEGIARAQRDHGPARDG